MEIFCLTLIWKPRWKKEITSLSLVWGLNNPISSTQNQPQEVLFHTHTQDQHAFLLEFLQKREAFTGFGRIEYVQKEAEELRLGDPPNGKPLWIGSLTAGVSREIALNAWCIFTCRYATLYVQRAPPSTGELWESPFFRSGIRSSCHSVIINIVLTEQQCCIDLHIEYDI